MSDLLDQLKHVFEGTEVSVVAVDEDGFHEVVTPELMPRMKGYGDTMWVLVDERGERVHRGRRMVSRNEAVRLTGGTPPHKPSSQGFVYVAGDDVSTEDEPFHSARYYASVVNLKWVKV